MKKSASSRSKPKLPEELVAVEQMMRKHFPHSRNYRSKLTFREPRPAKFPVKFPLNVPMSEAQMKKYKSYTSSPNSSYCFDFSRTSGKRHLELSAECLSHNSNLQTPISHPASPILPSLNSTALLSPETSMKASSIKSFVFSSESPPLNKRKSSHLVNKLESRCDNLQISARSMKRKLSSDIATVRQKLRIFKKHARLIEASNERAGVYMLKEKIQEQKNPTEAQV
mmetsp:Transcript_16948/g.30436  ORF Transcript_16948/g.30436 Transcript_16948/m.30436 type:complete len:226 (-) Transcript_16948:197-874(-)